MPISSQPHASIRTAIVRTSAAAFAAAALTFAASAAQADTADQSALGAAPVGQAMSPAPASSPAGQTNPGPGSNPTGPTPGTGGQPNSPVRPPAAPAPFSHMPVIDFVVTFTQPGIYNRGSQIPVYDPVDLGGTVRIPVTRKLNLFFDRITEGTLNQPLERVIQPPGGAVYPVVSRDVILQYHATYAFDRFVTLDVGESFRHRIWSFGSAASGGVLATNISSQPFPYTLSSTEHHFGYAGLSYQTKPWKDLWNSTFVLAETLDVQNVDHNVAIACTAAMITGSLNRCAGRLAGQVGYLDENPGKDKYYETTQGISWILPVDAKHGTTFLANERWGALNFYENAPFPYRWNSALTLQLSKRFSPGFTLAMRHTDFHAIPQGAPFLFPNAIHVGSWDVIGTFHLDTNTLFH